MNELDFIQTVKIQGQGYLLNGTMSVPMVAGNREYGLIKQWISAGNTPELEFSTEELEEQRLAKELAEQSAQRKADMLEGEVYTLNGTDYQVSFTKDDGDGLVQVKSAFDLGLTSTTIHFDNGTKLPITIEEFPAFAAWFVERRNNFFEV
jgi:hypothetical protein